MAKQIQIKISTPCHEKWSEMTPTQQGAFCKACQTNVIDYTNKPENEIFEMITKSGGTGCGRFYASQLETPIRKTEVNSSIFNWKAIAASLAALISAEWITAAKSSQPGMAYEIPLFVEDTIAAPEELAKTEDKDKDKIILTGKVSNGQTKEPVAHAEVYIADTDYKTVTDTAGKFQLIIPEYFLEEKEITARGFWYKAKSIQLKHLSPGKPVKIVFDMRDEIILGRW